jgi:hypothetical protein
MCSLLSEMQTFSLSLMNFGFGLFYIAFVLLNKQQISDFRLIGWLSFLSFCFYVLWKIPFTISQMSPGFVWGFCLFVCNCYEEDNTVT